MNEKVIAVLKVVVGGFELLLTAVVVVATFVTALGTAFVGRSDAQLPAEYWKPL